ncbi:MAG: histidine kinase, partial [Flavobacteriaceae bacterium]
DLETKGDKIFFRIFNTKPAIKQQTEQGALGLENVKKQLELLYPDAHSLQINDGNDGFLVSLIVKQY